MQNESDAGYLKTMQSALCNVTFPATCSSECVDSGWLGSMRWESKWYSRGTICCHNSQRSAAIRRTWIQAIVS